MKSCMYALKNGVSLNTVVKSKDGLSTVSDDEDSESERT